MKDERARAVATDLCELYATLPRGRDAPFESLAPRVEATRRMLAGH
jgi:hypothetical protein